MATDFQKIVKALLIDSDLRISKIVCKRNGTIHVMRRTSMGTTKSLKSWNTDVFKALFAPLNGDIMIDGYNMVNTATLDGYLVTIVAPAAPVYLPYMRAD